MHRQGQLLPAASLVRIVKVASEFLALAVLAPQQTPSDIGGELTSPEEFAAEEVSSGGTWLARLHIIKITELAFALKILINKITYPVSEFISTLTIPTADQDHMAPEQSPSLRQIECLDVSDDPVGDSLKLLIVGIVLLLELGLLSEVISLW